jgi:hypothetical protein
MKLLKLAAIVLALTVSLSKFSFAEVKNTQAFLADPLGVGSIELEFEKPLVFRSDQKNFELLEANRRALHSVIGFERKLSGSNQRDWAMRRAPIGQSLSKCTIYFLFTGDTELDLTLKLRDGRNFEFTINPTDANERHDALKKWWWKFYQERSDRRANLDGTGRAFEGYLSTMLARRLDVRASKTSSRARSPFDGTEEFLGTMLGTESIRAAMQKNRLLWKTNRLEKADRELPAGVTIPEVAIPVFPDDVSIEPIAHHVPEDCFYIRCGSFKNFNWLRDNIDELGSRFRDLVQRTTVDYQIQNRLQKQLALKETVLSRLLGGTAISDVALIGSDTFLSEGAGLGLIFEARPNNLLKSQLANQRKQAATEFGIKEKTIRLAGRDVALLNNDDNSVRSFYVVDGSYHLVTNSKKLVEDFLQCGKGQNCLANLKEFRHSRNLMKLEDTHTAFVYLSDPFFRRLLSPAIRTEMTRRIQAHAEIKMIKFAQVAAKAEGLKHQTIEELIAGEFLPDEFLYRSDRSHTKIVEQEPVDSLRGSRGVFLPVVDVDIEKITQSEFLAYAKFKTEYLRLWTRMDPVTIGITRKRVSKDRDKLVFQFHITPYVKRGGLGFISTMVAPKNVVQLQRSPGDLMGAEVGFNSSASAMLQLQGSTSFFAVFRDCAPKFMIERGKIVHSDPNLEPPFYIGGTRKHPLQKEIELDKDGYYIDDKKRTIFGQIAKVGRVFDDFQVHSNDRVILEAVTPNIKMLPAKRSAQLRVWVADLKESGVYPIINAGGYLESRKSSAGAAQFLSFVFDQLQVKHKRADDIVESLLGGKLVCPLGGEYKLIGKRKEMREWRSTQCKTASALDIRSIPTDYRLPLLEWFHGAELEFNISTTTLETRLELEVSPEK